MFVVVVEIIPLLTAGLHQTMNRSNKERNQHLCDYIIVRQTINVSHLLFLCLFPGSRMAETCVPLYHCGSHATGWLRGGHPLVGEGAVPREVCFHWLGDCCYFKQNVLVHHCSKDFFVYGLPGTKQSYLRYCGNGEVLHKHGEHRL